MYSSVRLEFQSMNNESSWAFDSTAPPFIVREVACHRTHDEVSKVGKGFKQKNNKIDLCSLGRSTLTEEMKQKLNQKSSSVGEKFVKNEKKRESRIV